MKVLPLLALALGVATVGAQRPEPPVIAALEQYSRGEFDQALATARAIGKNSGYASLDSDLERRGPAWINPVQGAARERRRFAAAAFALEVAHAGRDQWLDTRHLVEWGCGLLRDGTRPGSFEHDWQRAALSLVQAMRDHRFLIGPYPTMGSPDLRIRRAVSHLDHVEPRFPEDARFPLARVIAGEIRGLNASDSRHPVWVDAAAVAKANLLSRDLRFDVPVAHDLEERARTMQRQAPSSASMSLYLWELADRFHPFLADPAVRAEAHLRRGFTYRRLGRDDLAAAEIGQVERDAADVDVTYLARYFTAQIHNDGGRTEMAAAWYRRALDLAPQAQSSALALAALLFVRDEREEATALVQAAIAPGARDPWREYHALAFANWPAQVARLRAQLR